jgi:hypothetical protein
MFRLFIFLNVVLLTLATNLVVNPGAETGDFSGWTAGCNWVVSTNNAHAGNKKFLVGGSSSSCPLSQNITSLVIGADYQLSLWAVSVSGGQLNVNINQRLVISVPTLLPASYVQYAAVFTSTATVETLVISSNSALVDDIFIGILSNPTSQPSLQPASRPSSQPSRQPSSQSTRQPSCHPSNQPSSQPTRQPSCHPSNQPSSQPTRQPSCHPSNQPSSRPTSSPTFDLSHSFPFTGILKRSQKNHFLDCFSFSQYFFCEENLVSFFNCFFRFCPESYHS